MGSNAAHAETFDAPQRRHPLLTVASAARCLPPDLQSEKTIRHWIARGQLRSHLVGHRRLIRREDLAAFLGIEPHELPV
ncbi:MAG: helix-turn-helix domain-containing protein [Sandaracinaceae bacterium]